MCISFKFLHKNYSMRLNILGHSHKIHCMHFDLYNNPNHTAKWWCQYGLPFIQTLFFSIWLILPLLRFTFDAYRTAYIVFQTFLACTSTHSTWSKRFSCTSTVITRWCCVTSSLLPFVYHLYSTLSRSLTQRMFVVAADFLLCVYIYFSLELRCLFRIGFILGTTKNVHTKTPIHAFASFALSFKT